MPPIDDRQPVPETECKWRRKTEGSLQEGAAPCLPLQGAPWKHDISPPPPHKTTTVSASSQSLSARAILPLRGCNLAKPSSGPRTWQPKGSTHQPASRSASPRAQEGRPRFFSMWGRTSCLLGCSYRQGHLVYGIQAPFPLLPSQGWRGAVSICSGGCVSCLAPWHCQEERSGRSEGLCLTIDSGPGSAPPLPASTKFTEAIGSQQEQGAGPQQNWVA